jgi:hypothetical protein
MLTARTRQHLDGSIGCPSATADQGEGCFGLQPDIVARIAVIDVKGSPLVAWARTSAASPDHGLFGTFERMLISIRFR